MSMARCTSTLLVLAFAVGGRAAAAAASPEGQLAEARAEIARLNDQLGDARARLAALRDEMERVEAENNALVQRLITWRRNHAELQKERERLESALAQCKEALAGLRQPRQVGGIIWGSCIWPPPAREPIRGKVIAVNAGLRLLVINQGRMAGVKKRTSFIVFRGNTYVGKAVVDDVYLDRSAARYERDAMARKVRVGDAVTTKLVVDF